MKKILLFSIIALFSLSLFTSCTEQNEAPKYVFLFIGDGMGLGQQQLTESYLGAYNSTYPDPKLYFTSLPQKGFITTYSKSHKITDSAAAGTALAGGEKTDNGMIMKSGDGTEEYYSVAEIAKDLEMKVGIISSVSLDHATPAVFYANADSRNMYYEISMQLPDSDFDFFGGGGFKNPEGLDTEKKYSENYTHQDSDGEVV
ncbi:MAG: alkaline phosphatase, partial [Marinilabiliales bacterium]